MTYIEYNYSINLGKFSFSLVLSLLSGARLILTLSLMYGINSQENQVCRRKSVGCTMSDIKKEQE